jgi:acetylornithine deacetylase/succinyl-diaminopimelate desuccinylase-like protein
VDTVFPEETPLRFSQEDGRLTGPGVGDNATAVVVALRATAEVLRQGLVAPGAVVFTVGEEGLGNLRGACCACEALQPNAVVALEGHRLDEVIVDAVGSVRARVRVEGPGGHSWADRGTPSAVHAAAELVARLAALGKQPTPVNVGTIAGGQSVNTIAPSAELVVEMRALDEAPLDVFRAELDGLTVAEDLRVTVEELGRRPAARLDRSAPLLATVRAVRARLGLADALAEGSTDANAALARGIPALTLGCARGGGMHTTAEWIDPASVELGLRQAREVIATLLAP